MEGQQTNGKHNDSSGSGGTQDSGIADKDVDMDKTVDSADENDNVAKKPAPKKSSEKKVGLHLFIFLGVAILVVWVLFVFGF